MPGNFIKHVWLYIDVTRNPILNALIAAAYIIAVGTIFYVGAAMGPTKDTVLAPIAMLSLLVLSVLVMALSFFYQPALLFGHGETEAAIRLFAKSAGTFAVIAVLLFIAMLLFARPYPKDALQDVGSASAPPQSAAIQ